ncbi:MAG TPA: 2-dehydropantoate 2-reductase [Rhodobacteraceae bacterium]|nr:2-dehydropantoate 2-reductase [Paracoccaceae bacterium]
MKIAILGAGGVGGYLAAKLTEAGTPVALIARGAHLDAIRARGLKLIEPGGTTVTRPEVLTDDPREIGTPDAIVVTVKAHQLADAFAQIAPAVGPDTLVVTVQNGVDAPDMAAEAFGPARVAICVSRIFSNITAPGEITRYGAPRSFAIGGIDGGQNGAAVSALRKTLAAAGVLVPDCDDVRIDLWSKFLLFNAISSTTAAARTRVGVVRDTPALADLAQRLIGEACAVGRAEGIALADDAVEKTWGFIGSMAPESRASTAHDLEHGRALEIDHICGSVARRGRALGVDVTASETVAAVLAPFKLGTPG